MQCMLMHNNYRTFVEHFVCVMNLVQNGMGIIEKFKTAFVIVPPDDEFWICYMRGKLARHWAANTAWERK